MNDQEMLEKFKGMIIEIWNKKYIEGVVDGFVHGACLSAIVLILLRIFDVW